MIARFPLITRFLMMSTALGSAPALLAQNNYPAAVQQLVEEGVNIAGSFEAPGDLTGYVGEMMGQPVAFYLTPDGEHVIIGTMLSATGDNLTEAKVEELVLAPKNAQAWQQLEETDWVRDGQTDAPVIIYTFTDPNCPFCHRFHRAAQPWIDAGRVQLRHILVGIIKEDSLPKAATIQGADDPQKALYMNQENYSSGGIKVDKQLVSQFSDTIESNNDLMSRLGLHATPSTYYKDANGLVHMKQGAPKPEEMADIMGSPKP